MTSGSRPAGSEPPAAVAAVIEGVTHRGIPGRVRRAEPLAQSLNLDNRFHGDKVPQSGGAPHRPADPIAAMPR